MTWNTDTLSDFDEFDSDNGQQPYLPTIGEIDQACREIRQHWSLAEFQKRAGIIADPLEIREVKVLMPTNGFDND